MTGFRNRLKDEKGISAVIVAICLVALFGAAVLSIDAGSAWATRRKIVTGTDAAALAAARMFANGMADPCTVAGQNAAHGEATSVLGANSAEAEHDPSSGYQVTVSGCPSQPVGHVRFDAKLGSQQGFSGIFGFARVKPFSSSTAEFGYVTAPRGLRPIGICDQSTLAFTGQAAVTPPGPAPYPHYALFNWLDKGTSPALTPFTQTDYDRYFGTSASDYPSVSINSNRNNNSGKTYLAPAAGGGVVHRVNAKDDCTGGASWRGWVDLDGQNNSTGDIEKWLLEGFDGTVSLGDPSTTPATPPDCNASKGDEYCEVDTGNHNSSNIEAALDSITCPAATPSKDCFMFPIIVDRAVTGSPQARVQQVAFLFVILRGWGSLDGNDNNPCNGNQGCVFDFEFVDVQAEGAIGHNPSGNDTTPRGTALCGIDHDSQAHRCNV